jgi:hypothetical protein
MGFHECDASARPRNLRAGNGRLQILRFRCRREDGRTLATTPIG